jgi:hypothetical protein
LAAIVAIAALPAGDQKRRPKRSKTSVRSSGMTCRVIDAQL